MSCKILISYTFL